MKSRKIVIIGMLSIFLLSSVSLANANSVLSMKTKEIQKNKLIDISTKLEVSRSYTGEMIYVDDSNDLGPWVGTQENPYRIIQDAVDVSSYDDIVYVYKGSYCEDIVINTTIKLRGEDKEETYLYASSASQIIEINANGVEINNFTISGFEVEADGIEVNGFNCMIYDNIIKFTVAAIDFSQSNIFLEDTYDGLEIYKNVIKHNIFGVSVFRNDLVKVVDNVIYDNVVGIQLSGLNIDIDHLDVSYDPCENVDIFQNEIKSNVVGIFSFECEWINIYLNDIEDNDNVGIMVKNSNETIIFVNSIKNNGGSPESDYDMIYGELPICGIFLDDSEVGLLLNNIVGNKENDLYVVDCLFIEAKWNYWGGFLGPGFGISSDKIKLEDSNVNYRLWCLFPVRLAGDYK